MSAENARRQLLVEEQRREEIKLAVTTPRDPRDATWGYFGVGVLQAQLVRRSSRRCGVCYEIRGDLGSLRVLRSLGTRPGGSLVVGHVRVAAKASRLHQLLRLFEDLEVPVRRPLEPAGVLDGEIFELAVSTGLGASARFTWYGGAAPAGWETLAELTESCITGFDGLDGVDEG